MNYRRSILSFIKKSLEDYSEDEYKKFYNQRDNIIKPFCVSVFFKDSQFQGENIIVHAKTMEVNFSTSDYHAGIVLYNAFKHKKKYKI